MSDVNAGTKSLTVAYLLWFFLGSFGAHRFYFGRTGSAIGMLSLCLGSTVLSVFLIGLLGFPVLLIWWIADAIQIPKWMEEGTGAAATTQDAASFSQAA